MKKVRLILVIFILLKSYFFLLSQEDTTLVEQRVASVSYTSASEITIDGVRDENIWGSVSSNPIDHPVEGSDILINDCESVDCEGDISGIFKIAWSDDGLYLFIEVKDDVVTSQCAFDIEPDWLYDNIEIYTNYTGKRDAVDPSYGERAEQIRISVCEDNEGILFGTVYTIAQDSALHDYEILLTDTGYVVELFLPFAYIKPEDVVIPPVRWGFAINISDVDDLSNNPTREAIIGWNTWDQDGNPLTAQHWHNINYFGVLIFDLCCPDNLTNTETSNFLIFPNPTSEIIIFSFPDDKLYQLQLYSVLGQKVWEGTALNNTPINISCLQKGTYVLKAFNESYMYTEKIVIK